MLEIEKKYKVIQQLEKNNVTIEILELEDLKGAFTPNMATSLYFAKQQGLHIRFVKATLNDASIKTEAGALYYYKGNFETNLDVKGIGGLLKKTIMGGLTNESIARPEYSGTGEIFLEPSFKHYLLLELNNDSVIVDKGLFYAATAGVELKAIMQNSISGATMGGEGLFQLNLYGTGIVVLEVDVPENEIQQIQLKEKEILKVDGNFAILRTKDIRFSVTKSNKGFVSSAMGGEGFLNTFEGPGIVWLAPTLPIYHKLELGIPICNKNNNNREK